MSVNIRFLTLFHGSLSLPPGTLQRSGITIIPKLCKLPKSLAAALRCCAFKLCFGCACPFYCHNVSSYVCMPISFLIPPLLSRTSNASFSNQIWFKFKGLQRYFQQGVDPSLLSKETPYLKGPCVGLSLNQTNQIPNANSSLNILLTVWPTIIIIIIIMHFFHELCYLEQAFIDPVWKIVFEWADLYFIAIFSFPRPGWPMGILQNREWVFLFVSIPCQFCVLLPIIPSELIFICMQCIFKYEYVSKHKWKRLL